MDTIQPYLEIVYWGNPVRKYLIALGVLLLILASLYFIEKVVLYRLRHMTKDSETVFDDYAFRVIDNTRLWFLLAVALYISSRFLVLGEKVQHYDHIMLVLVFLLQVAIWGKVAINVWLKHYRQKNLDSNAAAVTTVGALGFLLKLALYSLVLLLTLENLGVNVTALVTGLGIGGVAVALAAQNVLGDLFASLAIVLDKPFVIGDFIVLDDFLGNVEAIGIKTTRLRSLGGEQIIISNSDLMKSRVRNFKRMLQRRIVFGVGVTYQTPSEKLQNIPAIVQDIIETQEKTRFDRAHFKSFGSSSLDFEVVYYVLSPDYNEYMDIQQAVNLEIFRRFEAEKIEFAYPTQTLFMEPAQITVENLETDKEFNSKKTAG